MNSPSMETEEPTSSTAGGESAAGARGESAAARRAPAKRRLSSTVIEISDTDSDDSDVCAVTSYQASADEVKRIRGADYSSSSSSSDYTSDSESPWEDDSVLVEDDRALSEVVRAQLNPRADRMEDPKLNPALKTQEVIDRLKTHWNEVKDYTSAEVSLTTEPFPLCRLHNFLANADFINNIIDDMNTLDWSRKKMDLYEFHQTADLASLTWQRGIKGIYELLKTEVMSWVSQVTGLELRSVSASCSLYGPGDHLLVHDDLLADRRVAFILYLAPWRLASQRPRPTRPHARTRLENGDAAHVDQVDVDVEEAEQASNGWCGRLGGALELVGRDERGRAAGVVRRVLPRNNMLAFFKVSHHSYHQVGEVLSLELPRLSINGWYHGPAPDEPPPEPEPAPEPPPEPIEPHNDVVVLAQWIEGTYMAPRNRLHIQAQMERDSEVCLRDFLLPQRVEALLAALEEPDVPWEVRGPSNRRRYLAVPDAWLAAREGGEGEGEGEGHPVREVVRAVGSAAFCRLLADCTDLRLTSLARLELQRWTPGDYTVLPAASVYARARLEAVLYLGVPGAPRALCGGATTYVAPEEAPAEAPGALVTLPPCHNALGLVYCEPGTASFTKYLSRITMRPGEHFYILTCTYYE